MAMHSQVFPIICCFPFCPHLSAGSSASRTSAGASAAFSRYGCCQKVPGERVLLQSCDISQSRLHPQSICLRSLSRVLLQNVQIKRTVHRIPSKPEEDSTEDMNLEEMDDEQLEEFFETYGEVVKDEPESAPVISEEDDDAESLAFAVALAEVANDVKAGEIQVLFVKPLVYWTRFFVIATGFSRPQVDAIGKRMRDMAEERFKRIPRGDLTPNAWTLLDFEDIVVHIFYPKERSFYNLEEFYGNATPVELPFASQSQMR